MQSMPREISREDEALSGRGETGRVWDLPVRLFHWTLVALIGFSWWSAENHHMDWHIWSGAAVLSLLIFRLLWGFFGSSTARFSSFVRGPSAIRDYVGGRWRGIGHSPLGALSVIGLLAAVAVQTGLGLFAEDEDGLYAGPLARLVSIDGAEIARDFHEAFFNLILTLSALHIAAILYYRLRGKKLVMPMITGRGEIDGGAEPLRPGRWWVALLCLVAAIGVTRWVLAGAPPL